VVMLLKRCSGGVATARVLQPRRRRGAVAASLAPSQQALQWPGCCSCGGVAAPSPPAPTVAAEGQGSRLSSLTEASTHQPPEHRRESSADPRQPVGCDGAATPPLRLLQHPGPGPPRYGCSRDSRMAPWRRVCRDSRASPRPEASKHQHRRESAADPQPRRLPRDRLLNADSMTQSWQS
jgi:hypothetical protein